MKTIRHWRVLFFVLLVMQVDTLFAQEKDDFSPWAVTLSVGASLPLGTFATMLEEPYRSNYGLSGRPSIGLGFGGMVEYELSSSIIALAQINYARMAAEDLIGTEIYPPDHRGGLGIRSTRSISSQDQGVWQVGQLLGGVGFRKRAESLSFTLHVEAGAQWTQSPTVEMNSRLSTWIYTVSEWDYLTQTVQPADGSWSLVAGGGVDLAVFLSPRFALCIGGAVHATTTNFSYSHMITTDGQRIDAPGTYYSSKREYLEMKQSITTGQFSLGLTYRFPSRQ